MNRKRAENHSRVERCGGNNWTSEHEPASGSDDNGVIIIESSQRNDDDESDDKLEDEQVPRERKREGAFLHHHLKILLVEDDDSTRQVVSALLRNCGYEVTPANSGNRAWEILESQENSVDLVLTDLVMPGLSGLELLSKIMSRESSKRIPVVMMSCHDSMEIVLKCLSRGAVDFLVKPVRKNELKNLWQHFWRMCLSSSGSGSGGSQTGKATGNSGSYGGSDHGDRGSSGLNVGGGSDNGSGTQSSWTKTKKPVEVQSHEDAAEPERDKHEVLEPHPEKNTTADKRTFRDPPHCKDLLGSIQNQREDGAEGANAATDAAFNDSTLELSLKRSRVKPAEQVEGDQNCILHHSGGSAFSRYSNNPPVQNSTSNSNMWSGPGSSSAEAAKISNMPQFKLDPSSIAAFQDMAVAYAQSLHNLLYHGSTWHPPSTLPEQLDNTQALNTTQHVIQQKEEDEHNNNKQRINTTQQCISSNKVLEAPSNGGNSGSECGNGNWNGNGSVNGSVSGSNNLSNNNMQNGHSSGAGLTGNGDSGNNGSSKDPVTGNEAGIPGPDSARLSRREVALHKFRQKRKERCFEKKVRYQSRKRLAEQRPRIRGQFVKQTPTYNHTQEEEGGEFETEEDHAVGNNHRLIC